MNNICDICNNNHATWEHRIYEKLKLAKSGVPLETLFIMPNEDTGDTKLNSVLVEINNVLEKS